jgi:hypothetical protein
MEIATRGKLERTATVVDVYMEKDLGAEIPYWESAVHPLPGGFRSFQSSAIGLSDIPIPKVASISVLVVVETTMHQPPACFIRFCGTSPSQRRRENYIPSQISL